MLKIIIVYIKKIKGQETLLRHRQIAIVTDATFEV